MRARPLSWGRAPGRLQQPDEKQDDQDEENYSATDVHIASCLVGPYYNAESLEPVTDTSAPASLLVLA